MSRLRRRKPMPDPSHLMGEEMKAIRLHLCLTQRDFGIHLGLSPKSAQGTVARWEAGKRIPSEVTLRAARALVLLDEAGL